MVYNTIEAIWKFDPCTTFNDPYLPTDRGDILAPLLNLTVIT